MIFDIHKCRLCPRRCGADRTTSIGFCGGGDTVRVAKATLHMWEEPFISGTRGSGTVFFSGCPLRCCFCQNSAISRENFGEAITTERLADIFLELAGQGAHNINLVSPTQYLPWIVTALEQVRGSLHIPVVYNTGGYEQPDAIKSLAGLVDIYLPDFKYKSGELAERYSAASDYFDVASAAIDEMVRQTGPAVLDSDGMLRSGTVIRHLVLPGSREDSKAVVRHIAERWGNAVTVSLMSQYTTQHYSGGIKELHRPVSSFEYNQVVELASELGLCGFMQERSSAKREYTPCFDLSGVLSEDKPQKS
ncbi:MAG: radical SAM protein [Angelakisella sp.]